jgi:signal transduction histidine kinase
MKAVEYVASVDYIIDMLAVLHVTHQDKERLMSKLTDLHVEIHRVREKLMELEDEVIESEDYLVELIAKRDEILEELK